AALFINRRTEWRVCQCIRDRTRVEHLTAGVVSPSKFAADFARRFVHTVLAPAIALPRETGQGSKRALEHPQDFTETNRVRRAQNDIPAALAPSAFEDAGLL